MIKELPVGRIVAHATEWVVVAGTELLPISKEIAYTKLAQFVHEHHARDFAQSLTCYHTAVIAPIGHNV